MSLIYISCVLSAFATVIILSVLIKHEDYEDGLFGRLAMVVIVFGCSGFVLRAVSDWWHEYPPEVLPPWAPPMFWGMFVFYSRHLYRFLRALKTGKGVWGAQQRRMQEEAERKKRTVSVA